MDKKKNKSANSKGVIFICSLLALFFVFLVYEVKVSMNNVIEGKNKQIKELIGQVKDLELKLHRKNEDYIEANDFSKTYRNQLNLCRTKLPK